MAFPWIFAENFEAGTKGGFDTETDTISALDFAHYKTLANYPWKCAPYSGAYCVRLVLSGGTADATLTEADVDIADTVTNYFRFELWFSPTFTGTSNDTFALLELKGAAAAVTVSFGARIVATTNVINLGIGGAASAAVPSTFSTQEIQRGVWYTVELKVNIQSGGTGTLDIYATKAGEPTQIASVCAVATVTNIAVTDAVLGIQDQLATTTGVILINSFIHDDARIYPTARYVTDQVLHMSQQHVFVGPGWIAGAAILSGTNPTMVLWDTDEADVNSTQSYEISLATAATNQSSIGGHIYFQKGCYAVLGGTSPIGQVMLARSDFNPGVMGPLYFSDSGVKRLARGG